MDSKTALDAIKKLLGINVEENKEPEAQVAEVKQNFSTINLKDGTVISFDVLEIGSVVSKVLEDGTTEDMPAGEYEMEDGTIIVIGEGSKITEIKPVEAPAETEEEAAVETEVKQEEVVEPVEGEGDERIAKIEERLGKIEEALAMIIETISGQKEEMSAELNDAKKELSERLKVIEKSPASDPVHFSKVAEPKDETIAERRIRLLNQK